jgi:hypothetical protein
MTRAGSEASRPLLLVDIDGVISLFGVQFGAPGAPPRAAGSERDGSFHSIEGMPHFLSATAAAHLLSLAEHFELVWASGWEERANEHLPHLLGLPERLPFLRFPRGVVVAGAGTIPGGFVAAVGEPEGSAGAAGPKTTLAHWKLESVDAYAGERPLAWIDDAFNSACHEWAATRASDTLLVPTDPERGLTSREARLLEAWARELRERPQAGG